MPAEAGDHAARTFFALSHGLDQALPRGLHRTGRGGSAGRNPTRAGEGQHARRQRSRHQDGRADRRRQIVGMEDETGLAAADKGAAAPSSFGGSAPSAIRLPGAGLSSAPIRFSSVDLPEPGGPMSETGAPFRMCGRFPAASRHFLTPRTLGGVGYELGAPKPPAHSFFRLLAPARFVVIPD